MHKFIFLFLLYCAQAMADKPPEAVLSQLGFLERVEASINICTNSPEFRSLTEREKSFLVVDATRRIDVIIESIEKKYKNDSVYLIHKIMVGKLDESQEFKRNFARIYNRKCDPKLLVHANYELNRIKEKINSLLVNK